MGEAYEGLQIVDMIGVFYEDGNALMVADEFDGAVDVLEALKPVEGKEVRLLAHHRPVEPIDKTRWGGGCCQLENTGHCHFGHHENPQSLYTFNAVGTLRVEDLKVFIDTKKGASECLMNFLVAHRSQIVVTSIPNLEDIAEKVKSFDPSNIEKPTLENLTERLSDLRDFLGQMQDMKDKL